jgi:hypothetical protein
MLEASFGTIGNLVGTKCWENQILEKIQIVATLLWPSVGVKPNTWKK